MSAGLDEHVGGDTVRNIEGFRRVERAFRKESKAGEVRHDLISPMFRVPDTAGWQAFQRANSPPGPLVPQAWEVCEGGAACGRYEGESARVTRFRDLAAEAFTLLKEVECPEGGWVRLPKQDAHPGWIEVVYRTARCYATADLRASFGWWNWTGGITLNEDDHWGTDAGGASYPLHPAYERLVDGLFGSSSDAIRLWFDPNLALRVGECVQESPVAFTLPYSLHRSPPEWDGRTLWCDGGRVKSFPTQATACKSLLDAFQKADWPRAVDGSAIQGMKYNDAKLGNAIYRVNNSQNVIRFDRDGNGWLRWFWPGERPTRRVYRGRAKRPGGSAGDGGACTSVQGEGT